MLFRSTSLLLYEVFLKVQLLFPVPMHGGKRGSARDDIVVQPSLGNVLFPKIVRLHRRRFDGQKPEVDVAFSDNVLVYVFFCDPLETFARRTALPEKFLSVIYKLSVGRHIEYLIGFDAAPELGRKGLITLSNHGPVEGADRYSYDHVYPDAEFDDGLPRAARIPASLQASMEGMMASESQVSTMIAAGFIAIRFSMSFA